MRAGLALALGAASSFGFTEAWAVDLAEVNNKPLKLDVTETSIASQQFQAREGERFVDHGYGAWINRLNAALHWDSWVFGTRLDSSVYWLRAEDRSGFDPSERENVVRDGSSRFRDAMYASKVWATYTAPGLEVTAGDAYVQFGRGLILSMRKIDELGVDTTVRGAKLAWQSDPFAATLVAGVANPSRIDEATGRALFLPRTLPGDSLGPQPLFGSDRIVGAQIQAGRGLPVTLLTHAVRFTRCAPFAYDERGRVIEGTFDAPLGSCSPRDTALWLATLPPAGGPLVSASEIDMAAQAVEVPSLWGHGKLYVEGAVQRRVHDGAPNDANATGNALYGSLSTNIGPVTTTFELKSYRNFYAVPGAVDVTRASALNNILYSAPPTTELITQDNMYGFFNACVDGGRLRTDVRLAPFLLVYGTASYAYTKTEIAGGGCDRQGRTVISIGAPEDFQATVWDGVSGLEWTFDDHRSHLFASGGVRNNEKANGDLFYRELHAEYALSKHISGAYAFELTGRHRARKEELQNVRDGAERTWREGEHYSALKIAPKWVVSQGIEYTTRLGFPTTYFNGALLYRFRSDSNLRLFVGQQRGGLKCVSGICKVFPPFEGARVEVTVRF